MLYPKNESPALSDELFRNPTSEYRGTPFWAWNCKIKKEEALRQIECFREMGFGGFHIHSRTGLDTPYLGKEFMEAVRACSDKAEQEKMLCWLYDEDRWPSGAAGGYVTEDPKFRARRLLFCSEEKELCDEADGGPVKLLARYAVLLENDLLKSYRRLSEGETVSGGEVERFAYLEVNENHQVWYNDFAYADTLNKAAIDKFIKVTHEKYYETLGDRFSKSVPAIFSDEPQFNPKQTLRFPNDAGEVRIPYTDDLDDTYYEAFGEHLLDRLPEVFWEMADGLPSLTRYHYHDHTAERFARAFADNIGGWCEEHKLMMTGHMMEEPTLHSQSAVLGDAMRSYRSFQLPGIDMLCDQREYTTAKQAQSAAHQYGRPGVLSELYGVTNWDFDFRGHKQQGDWQAALGVTVRVPHLSWMSMAGEAKRDFPASISFQSPWFRDYRFVEDHYARVNTALTRGTPLVRIGVIHPVESYWLHYGNNEQTAQVRGELERNFSDITNWLLRGLQDFDFICESLLPSQCPELPAGDHFPVGKMAYDVVIVPGCETIRRTTLDRLSAFAKNGGRVIFAGQIPQYVDAIPSNDAKKLAEACECVHFSQISILKALEDLRTIDLINYGGHRPTRYFSQQRIDGENRWLFLANAEKDEKPDVSGADRLELYVNGLYDVTLYDTMSGDKKPMPARHENGKTVVPVTLYSCDSLLLFLTPAKTVPAALPEADENKTQKSVFRMHGPVPVTLDEPNVLLLDQAEYRLDDGAWCEREEILRLDNKVRDLLGYPWRCTGIVQPWTVSAPAILPNTLYLRFRIHSEISVDAPYLALENAANTKITVNGTAVTAQPDGWYVDPCLSKIKLPSLKAGENVIELEIRYGRKTDVEWCYLLGDFGVKAVGDTAYLTKPVRELYFSDWAEQGLPFYGGNVTYHLTAELPAGDATISATRYRGAALKASVDGEDDKVFAYAPYECDLGTVSAGKHTVDLTVLGSRVNSFGQIHNCDLAYGWYGPDSWRTTGVKWSYEYELRQMGLLKAPELIVRTK